MDNLAIILPIVSNKRRACLSCIHCPVLVTDDGTEIDVDSFHITEFIRTRYVKPLLLEEYSKLSGVDILWSKKKGCGCPNDNPNLYCHNAILTYRLRYFRAGIIPRKKESSTYGKNLLFVNGLAVRDDGTLSDMYGHTDSCPGHELKDSYKTEI